MRNRFNPSIFKFFGRREKIGIEAPGINESEAEIGEYSNKEDEDKPKRLIIQHFILGR